jgi:phosphate butyryltransferase
VLEKRPGNLVVLETLITGRGGDAVVHGTAEVLAPTRKLEVETENVPGMLVHRHKHFERLLAACKDFTPLATAIIAPDEEEALVGALAAAEHGLIRPILIGDKAKIASVARKARADISEVELIDVPGHQEAAARAIELVREGNANALMKGNLHTGDLMREVIRHPGGLRPARRVSHVFVFDVPGVDHLLLVSDAVINITPNLEHKVDIVQNAIDVARALGIERPKVGILSALETVNIKIPSTLDAAILSKMAERGQIKGGIVDGPLAMDNAVDVSAARTRGISSLVAGRAEVLIVPNLEAGNMLAKELMFIAHADGAGIAVGAQVPIILTNRADDSKSRLVSCAMALLYHEWVRGERQSGNSAAMAAE